MTNQHSGSHGTPIFDADHAADGASDDSLAGTIAQLAVDRGFSTAAEVKRAHELAKVTHEPLAEALVKAGALTKGQYERLTVDAEAAQTGKRIPGYAMLAQIGRGATAAVFKARQESLDRIVAIKVLPENKASDEKLVEAFYAEGRAAASLNHPNIVQAIDVGRIGAHHYFVMEYVQGKTIFELLKEHQLYDEESALTTAVAIAGALQHAHEQGLIHRDVKPKNILMTAPGDREADLNRGVPKLLDLGLARLVRDEDRAKEEEGRTLGTPYYISPEQIRGDRVITPATDIYSLGATIFTMLTGRVPYPGKSLDEVLEKHEHAPIPVASELNPLISEGLSEVLVTMMAKEAANRYDSCASLLVELRAWLSVAELRRGERRRGG